MKELEAIIQKVRIGEGITDPELDKALAFFLDMEKGLSVLGPSFHLAWKECMSMATMLEGFKVAREQNRAAAVRLVPPPAP